MTIIKTEEFIKHACEQVLRFSIAGKWNDLSEEIKVQLGFNMGAMALGLSLSKEDGFLALANLRTSKISMKEFRKHIESIVSLHNVKVDENMINRSF